MEEKQKKRNSYDVEFYKNVTKRVREITKPEITSGDVLGIIADEAGDDYKPSSGSYLLKKWVDSVKGSYTVEKKSVFSPEKGRKVHSFVYIPKEGSTGPVTALRGNEKKTELITNIIRVLDKQEAARNNELFVPNLRDMWEGDEDTKGIAILCKAAKTLKATFGFGFTYDHVKWRKTVKIQEPNKLREKLKAVLPNPPKKEVEKDEEENSSLKLNQFVRLTDVAKDAMYLMAAAINKAERGIELYSLTKFVNEAPSLITKNLSATDVKILVKTVGKEYFTFTDGSNIISLTVGGWEAIQKKYDPKERLVELLVLSKEMPGGADELNKEIGLYNLMTDCTWSEYKRLGRLVYTGKIKFPCDPELEEKLVKDVENDLIKVQELSNPLA